MPLRRWAAANFDLSHPRDIEETWPGAKLNDAENQLLARAVQSDLRDLERDRSQKTGSASVDSADLNLGKLGQGVLVRMSGSCADGVTGNCPLYAYFRETGGFSENSRRQEEGNLRLGVFRCGFK